VQWVNSLLRRSRWSRIERAIVSASACVVVGQLHGDAQSAVAVFIFRGLDDELSGDPTADLGLFQRRRQFSG
jgi:hypothetical protein